jgi:hypothetical protein
MPSERNISPVTNLHSNAGIGVVCKIAFMIKIVELNLSSQDAFTDRYLNFAE